MAAETVEYESNTPPSGYKQEALADTASTSADAATELAKAAAQRWLDAQAEVEAKEAAVAEAREGLVTIGEEAVEAQRKAAAAAEEAVSKAQEQTKETRAHAKALAKQSLDVMRSAKRAKGHVAELQDVAMSILARHHT